MKINEECIRDVLSYLINNLTIQIINNKKGDFNSISLLYLMETFDEKYSKEDVWYSIYNLSQDRYIETDDIRSKSRNGFAFVNIYNVTHRGHEFYEIIQPESIWDKTKSVVSKVGVHTLWFIECTAHDIAVESAKQAVTIAMTKNTQQ